MSASINARAAGPGPSIVSVSGRQLIVRKRNPDGTLQAPAPFVIRGVDYSPASIDTATSITDPNNANVRRLEFGRWYVADVPLLGNMNTNTLRLYNDPGYDSTLGPVGLAFLDKCYEHGIMVIMTVDDAINNTNRLQQVVNYYKNHPAILAWSVGNEWNINLYYGAASSIADAVQRTETAAVLIKTLDTSHPVVSSYGDIDINDAGRRLADTANYVNNIAQHVDVWSLNIFRGASFGSLFTQWASITSKPMFIGEFGTDAFHSTALTNPNPPGSINETEQAEWDVALWNEIFQNLSAANAAKTAIGGTIFEFNDEWWKILPFTSQQTGGWIAGVFPDGMSSEEIFGLVDINRTPRLVYSALRNAYSPDYTPPSSSTRYVLNINDSGPGSLRQAIADATSGDTILFGVGVAGTIVLTSGEISIDKNLTIGGPGPSVLTVSGNNARRIFNIGPRIVHISGLRIANGSAPDFGGGLIKDNTGGDLRLHDCAFDNNFAGTAGDGSGQGGAVFARSSVAIDKCSFSNNTSTGNGGAVRSTGALNITMSTFSGNVARYFGGALYNFGPGVVERCTFWGNSNVAQFGVGGAMWNENNLLVVRSTTISGNAAKLGGGIANKNGTINLLNVTLSGNTAQGNGGAIYNGYFQENGGTLNITSSTISGNSSSAGGGVYVLVGTTSVRSSIIAGNTAPAGGPDWFATAAANSGGHNVIGVGTSGFTNGLNGDQVGTPGSPINALLGPLADNGGPTRTRALLAGSPAIDSGDSAVLASPFNLPTDQRGFRRTAGVRVDAGAFELGADQTVPSEILWRHLQTGDVALWRMNGNALLDGIFISTVSDLGWQIAGTGDVDRNLTTDIVWRHNQTGAVAVWLMDGHAVLQAGIVSNVSDLHWQIAGVGSLDDDSKADILWRNEQTGDVAAWLMDGLSLRQAGIISNVSDLHWQIAGMGNLDDDNKADILWRNEQTGDVAAWLMDGLSLRQAGIVSNVPDLHWHIAGIGDLTGEGKVDILWRHDQTGQVAGWLMDGFHILQAGVIAAVPDQDWQIAAVGDFDADFRIDVVWRHRPTGDVAVWLLDWLTLRQGSVVQRVADQNWQIQ
jgi:predicted outer membrane repeat protein